MPMLWRNCWANRKIVSVCLWIAVADRTHRHRVVDSSSQMLQRDRVREREREHKMKQREKKIMLQKTNFTSQKSTASPETRHFFAFIHPFHFYLPFYLSFVMDHCFITPTAQMPAEILMHAHCTHRPKYAICAVSLFLHYAFAVKLRPKFIS